MIDAVDPTKTRYSVTANHKSARSNGATTSKRTLQVSDEYAPLGLAEYLNGDDHEVDDVIQPTQWPGVDLIANGSEPFPAEAMASTRLAHLLSKCRDDYSLILVRGPSAEAMADLQMLVARADSVVLAVDGRSYSFSKETEAVVSELIELGAPLVGVVS